MNVQTITNCVRIMEYKNMVIHYSSGITADSVKVSATDCFEIMKKMESTKIGYVVDMYDMVNMLSKAGVISKAIFTSMMEEKLVFDLENFYVPVDDIVNLCTHYKMDEFSAFLKNAKKQINDIGLYVGKISFNENDVRQCNDKNLSNFLDLEALSSYANLNGIYEDELYISIADIITNIVFGEDLEVVRQDLNLYYEDFLCNHIEQKEYDEICLLCKIISYMMKHCDISLEGMSIFAQIALKSMYDEYVAFKPIRKDRVSSNISDYDYDYNDDDIYFEPIRKRAKSKEELNELKKYL